MADRIPIKRAEEIAKAHGYDQVIVYARRVGEAGQEWVTTYGIDKAHCAAAARIGDAIGRQVVTPLEEVTARAESAERERDAAKALAQKLSKALLKVRPLGGSELFTRIGDEFYADPKFCGEAIDELRADLHKAKVEVFAQRRQAADRPAPAVLRRVRHLKRGTTYQVLGEAEVQISKGHPGPDHAGIGFHLAEGDRLMVYRAEADGSLWIRTPEEFNDGRFEDVAISVGSAHV